MQSESENLENDMASTQMPHQTEELDSHATKINFMPKLIRRDKEYYYIFIKGTMHRKYICTENLSTLFYKANTPGQKGKTRLQHNNSGSYNTTFSPIDRSSRPKKKNYIILHIK